MADAQDNQLGADVTKELLQKLLQKPLVKGDTWYLVEKGWMKQCKKFLGFDRTTLVDIGGANPGPIDNAALYKDVTTGEIRRGLLDEIDYVLVPDDAWTLLTEKFGTVRGQMPIARKVVEYREHRKVEVYYIQFQLAENSDLDNYITKEFSRLDTLGRIERVIRELFNIPNYVETRLWNKFTSNTYELLSPSEDTVQEAGIFQGLLIFIECRDKDGRWPRETKRNQPNSFKKKEESRHTNELPGVLQNIKSSLEQVDKDANAKAELVEEQKRKKISGLDKLHSQEINTLEEERRKKNAEINQKIQSLKKKFDEKKYKIEVECKKQLEAIKKTNQTLIRRDGKVLASVGEDFECPVCLELMPSPKPIMQCASGHLVCQPCYSKDEIQRSGCPVCRGPLAGRCVAMEKLRDKLLTNE